MTTEKQILQSDFNADIQELIGRIEARADNAYIAYIGQCRCDECLGYEYKMDHGLFREAELKAHKDAAEKLGRHRALGEAASLLRELLSSRN